LLRWSTSYELDNAGFNVYREQAGKKERINSDIVLGSVFIAGQNVPLRSGYAYSWFDPNGTAESLYSVEAVGLDGTITTSTQAKPQLKERVATEGSDFGRLYSQQSVTTQKEYPAEGNVQPASTEGQIEDQWSIAAQLGLKIGIKKNGWYRVTQQQSSSAGFNPIVDIANLRLFNNGREVAILTNKLSGQFVSGDYIEFFGLGIDTLTTGTNIYYLLAGTTAGKRVQRDVKHDSLVEPPLPAVQLPQTKFDPQVWFWWLPTASPAPAAVLSTEAASTRPNPKDSKSADDEAQVIPMPVQQNPPISQEHESAKKAEVRMTAEQPLAKVVTSIKQEASPMPAIVPAKSKTKRRTKRTRRPTRTAKRKFSHAVALQTAAPSFDSVVENKERINYFVSLINGDTDNFFGRVLSAIPGFPVTPLTYTLTILNPYTAAATPARLEISLQGVSFQNHVINVEVNNVPVGSLSYSAQQHFVKSFDVPLSQLLNGDNTIKLTPVAPPSNPGSLGLVDNVRLVYPHTYQADNNSLSFSLRTTQSVTIPGFSTSKVRLIDYSDPYSTKVIRPIASPSSPGFAISVAPGTVTSKATQRLLYALGEADFDSSATLSLNEASSLNLPTNAADLVIIAHKNFMPSMAPLISLRTSQGMIVKLVDVEDIYDEFGYGAHGPQAIKDFLARANSVWATKPRYVILAGDGTYDPRDYRGLGDRDFVPTKLVDATYNETASDDWLTDFNNDGIADIPIGRLPINTVAQANTMVSKIVNFSPANVPQNALLVADDPTGYYFNFETANDAVQTLLQPVVPVSRINRRTEPSACAARTNLIGQLNQGLALVNYSGHGNVDAWAGNCANPLPGDPGHTLPVFGSADALALTNGNKLSVVVVMDCLNGYFQEPDPAFSGLAEAFLQAPNGGAVASFASSGSTIPEGQHEMSTQLFTLLYGAQPIALGDAIKNSKSFTNDIDVRRTWVFFGDPSMKVR
jgi:hypothetical protein